MRVFQVATSDIGGGAEKVASDLHRSLRARDIDSWELVGFKNTTDPTVIELPNEGSRSAWARGWRGAAHVTNSRMLSRAFLGVAEPGRALARMRGFEDFEYPGSRQLTSLGPGDPDVVHLHNLHGNYFDLRSLPALSANVPTVITLHDTWLMAGHCAYVVDCDAWNTGCSDCSHLDAYPPIEADKAAANLRLKRSVLGQSRLHVVGPSRWVLDQARYSVLSAGALSVHHIENGVDQTIFKPGDRRDARRRLGIEEDADVLVFSAASFANRYKDAETILRAAEWLPAQRGGGRPTIVALGAGGNPDYDEHANIIAVPFLENPHDVATYLQAADIYTHAAHAENQPLAVLEALSCGVPVIATDVGGIAEVVTDGVDGVVVASGDAPMMGSAVTRLLGDRELLRALSAGALESARPRFGLDRMVDEYVALYEELVGEAAP